MPKKFEYTIDGKIYFQKPLVWGQVKQIKAILPSIAIPGGMPFVQGLIFALGDHLPLLIAIVLIPEGGNPKDKDIESLAQELEFELDLETIQRVVEDFFECNSIASLAVKLDGILKAMQARIQMTTPLIKSSSSSPEGTSAKNARPNSESFLSGPARSERRK